MTKMRPSAGIDPPCSRGQSFSILLAWASSHGGLRTANISETSKPQWAKPFKPLLTLCVLMSRWLRQVTQPSPESRGGKAKS